MLIRRNVKWKAKLSEWTPKNAETKNAVTIYEATNDPEEVHVDKNPHNTSEAGYETGRHWTITFTQRESNKTEDVYINQEGEEAPKYPVLHTVDVIYRFNPSSTAKTNNSYFTRYTDVVLSGKVTDDADKVDPSVFTGNFTYDETTRIYTATGYINENGECRFENVPSGEYKVTIKPFIENLISIYYDMGTGGGARPAWQYLKNWKNGEQSAIYSASSASFFNGLDVSTDESPANFDIYEQPPYEQPPRPPYGVTTAITVKKSSEVPPEGEEDDEGITINLMSGGTVIKACVSNDKRLLSIQANGDGTQFYDRRSFINSVAYDSSSGYTFFSEMSRFQKQISAHTTDIQSGLTFSGTSLNPKEVGSTSATTFTPTSARTIFADDAYSADTASTNEHDYIRLEQMHLTKRFVGLGAKTDHSDISRVPISYLEYYYYNGSATTYQSYESVASATYKNKVSIDNNKLTVTGFTQQGKNEVQYYEPVLKPFKLNGAEVNRQYDYIKNLNFEYSAGTKNENLLTQFTFDTEPLPKEIFYPKRPRISLLGISRKNGQYGFFTMFYSTAPMSFNSSEGDNNISLMPYVNDGKTIDSAKFFSGETDNYYSKRYTWYYDEEHTDKYVSFGFSDLFNGYQFDLYRHLGVNGEGPTVQDFVNSYKIQGPSSRCWYWSHGEPEIRNQISAGNAADIPLRSIREMYFSGIVLSHPENLHLTCGFSGWTSDDDTTPDEFTYLLNINDRSTTIRPTKEYKKIQIGLGTAYAYHCLWEISGLTENRYETIHDNNNNIIRDLTLYKGDAKKTIKLRPRMRLEKHSFSASGVSPITLTRKNESFRVERDGEHIGWYGGIRPTDGKQWFNSIPLLEDNDSIEDNIAYSNNNGQSWSDDARDADKSFKNLECFERRRYTTIGTIPTATTENAYAAKMSICYQNADSDGWTTVEFEPSKYVTGTTTFCFQGTTTDVLFPPLWFSVTAQ